MADLGTSGGLQGIYQGDIAQNRPAYIKSTPNTIGDDIIDVVDKQEKKKKDEEDAFNKQLDPFISIDGTKYLPERVPLIKEQSQKVLQEAMKVRGKKGNVMLDENVNREVTKLQELQSKYGREAAYTKEIATKLNGDEKYEYTEEFRKKIGKAIEGTAGLDDKNFISSEMADEAQTFYKYGTPKAQTDLFEFLTPDAKTKVTLKVMQPDGTYKETVTEGSQIYNTKEGQESQYQKFLEFTRNGQDPHAKYFLKEATKQINANDNLAFQQSLLSKTELEAQEFVAQEAAKIMLERAMTTNKLKTADKTTKIPTGFNFTNNFQSTGGGGAIGKIWTVGDPIDQPLYETTAEGKPIIEKPLVKNGKFFSLETVAGAENPKNIYLKGYSDAAIVGLTRNEDTGKVEYATIEIPEKTIKGVLMPAEKKYVKIGEEDVSSIRNNIGAGQYDVSIGNWKKPKGEASKFNDNDIVKIKINGIEYTQTVKALKAKGYKESEFIK